jgi:predicted transposase/invertase (TIGR01784 family)
MQGLDDRGYTKLFSNKEIFRQLIVSFVREEWVKDLDFSQCELVKDSFLSGEYKKTFSDLLYKVKLRGRDLYIVILLEFKSAPARFVAVQVAGYILDFYRHLVASEKRLRKLPPVFPVLLYNGKKRWNAPKNLSELVESAPILGEYGLECKYFPIIENAFRPKELQRLGNIVSTLFLAETNFDGDALAAKLDELFDKEEDKQAASLFVNWFAQLYHHGRIAEADYAKLERVYQSKQEVSMLIEAIQKEKAQIRAQGERAGKRKGAFKKGLEVAKSMLFNGESIEKIKLYTGLSDEALAKLQKSLRQ